MSSCVETPNFAGNATPSGNSTAPSAHCRSLIDRDKDVLWHPFSHHSLEPPRMAIRHGEGAWLVTEDGKQILDAVSSWWVNLHGHGNRYIAEAIAEQATRLEHCIFAGFTHEPAVTLSELVLEVLPSNQKKIFFSDNGSTAVEVGIKMAIQADVLRSGGVSRRKTVVALEGGYHGDTFGAMSVSGRGSFTAPFFDYLFDVKHISVPTPENLPEVCEHFEALCRDESVLAFIYEPLVQGAGGMNMYGAPELNRLLTIAKQHDVTLIADEVMTGFGRTGTLFASAQMETSPDIMCLSKGITGGFLPLGATTCTEDIYQAFENPDRQTFFFHGHSYAGNPLACAAGIASMQLLRGSTCTQQLEDIAQSHKEAVTSLQDAPGLEHTRSLGTIFAVDLQTNEATNYQNPLRDRLYSFFLDRGLLIRPLGNVLYVMPPYCTTRAELARCYDAIREAGSHFLHA